MKGETYRILNEKTVMKEVELFIKLPTGGIKPFMIRVGDIIQVSSPKPKDKKKADKRKRDRRL